MWRWAARGAIGDGDGDGDGYGVGAVEGMETAERGT